MSNSDRADLVARMMLSRECDRRSGLTLRQGNAWFAISSAGHEAFAALGDVLTAADHIFPHYRDRAIVMARGMTVEDVARDLMGKADSHSGGRSMTSHFSHRPGNVVSVASPTASQCLPAAGAAWAAKLRGDGSAVLCSLGEASSRQGEFFEALAFAVQNQLPLVFLIADNGYGISTPTHDMNPRHLGLLPAERLSVVDGSDPDAVRAAGQDAFDRARGGFGPVVLWCELDRLESHSSSDDHKLYRPKAELASLRDPISRYAARLVADGVVTQEWVDARRLEIADEVEQTFTRVASEPAADVKSVSEHVFGSSSVALPAPQVSGGTMVAAVNTALRAGLDRYPEMIVFGEDVADPKGGVFGFTKGLDRSRVINSPLAEATIVGAAVGLAAAGMRPVVELQFVDFVGPAWNQITGQLTTLRWRSLSDWTCPVVMYAPWGAYLPGGGIWHSQSNESLFTHLPGLRVVVPSTPEDTEAAFLTAFAGEDPTLILLPKHLMRRRCEPVASSGVGARIVRPGSDVTIVTWGNGVELAVEAADRLEVSPEIIDLRWLVPWDRETVAASLRRTGRLVVVQEDGRTSSFGATVIAELSGADDDFYSLLAPPRLVAKDDVHIPFHPDLERAVLPSVDDVVAAVRSVLI
ncbi:alpha-ketoacid dehydrogenase subunit alpha/beta [Kutzneria chonburiensis]|uniref:dihydrolipoyllysine-residue succinyltransferase n=1 Tax=Kutzneria chonburiensis TaxID=1483604 RepID=A0ABV6N6P4_9PSEU|nr:alpha-ketoacid dehydrogenase subunit alpha/beta [Kutzneria chonburiensis]